MGRAEYMREWRKSMRTRHKCPNCGAESAGHYYCEECRAKKQPYNREYSSHYNAEYWAANKDWINAGRRKHGKARQKAQESECTEVEEKKQ